jgi:hypothetical protein
VWIEVVRRRWEVVDRDVRGEDVDIVKCNVVVGKSSFLYDHR